MCAYLYGSGGQLADLLPDGVYRMTNPYSRPPLQRKGRCKGGKEGGLMPTGQKEAYARCDRAPKACGGDGNLPSVKQIANSSSDRAAALPPGGGSSGYVNAATASAVIGNDFCGVLENRRRGDGAAEPWGSARDIANRRNEGGTSRISDAVCVPLGTLISTAGLRERNDGGGNNQLRCGGIKQGGGSCGSCGV
jgi:hypothetical protein